MALPAFRGSDGATFQAGADDLYPAARERAELTSLDLQAKLSPFLGSLKDGQDAGNSEHIKANMPRIVRVIAEIQDRQYELAKLAGRLREIRQRDGRDIARLQCERQSAQNQSRKNS